MTIELSQNSEVIRLENLRFRYPTGKEVIHGVDLRIYQDEFVGICGPNGAGKTTLCLCMKGLIPHSQPGKMKGKVFINSKDIADSEPSELADTVAMVFQDPEAQIIGLTVAEDLAYGPENLEIPREEILQRIPEILNLVGLSGFEDRETYNLSGGEKQRIAIASALMMMPKILILDEPTSELDPIGKTKVLQVLHQLRNQRKMTIIVVEHDLERLATLADRIIMLDRGKIIVDKSPRHFFSDIALFRSTGGERLPQAADLLDRLNKNKIIPQKDITPFEDEAVSKISRILKGTPWINLSIEKEKIVPNAVEDLKPIISVENMSYEYKSSNKFALEDVSLKIQAGEFLAFVGQNGAGKTTLAKLLNGILKPTKGKVIVKGLDTLYNNVETLAKYVGYCYQNPDHQIFAETVYSEIAFGPSNIGFQKDELHKKVIETLQIIDFIDKKDTYPFLLSRGERQILAVASVAAMGVDVMVVDEPTTGMDLTGGLTIMNLLSEWNSRGKTMIIITHDMNIIAEYIPRIIVFSDGHIIADGSPSVVFDDDEVMEKSFLSPPQITRIGKRLQKYGIPSGILTVNELFKYIIKKISHS